MLNCTVSVIDRLIVRPVVSWEKNGGSGPLSVPLIQTNVSNTMTTLILYFDSLNTFDAGQYTCRAVVTVPQINLVTMNTDSEIHIIYFSLILYFKSTYQWSISLPYNYILW